MWLQTPYSFYYVERKKKLQQSGHLQRQCCVSGSCQTGVLGCRINGRSIGGTCTGAGYPGKNNASQRLGRESLQFHVRCKRNYFFKSKVWVKCNYWIHVNMSPHNIIKLGFVFSDTEIIFTHSPIIHQSVSAKLASCVKCFVLLIVFKNDF